MNRLCAFPCWRRLVAGAVALLALLSAGWAAAQPDPPGRVGRIADLRGEVWLFDDEAGEWIAAVRNQPLTAGDRLSTSRDARAELRIGSTTLRLAGGTEIEALRLDDEALRFQLHAGSLALRVRSRDLASEIELVTGEAVLRPLRAGHYRVDRQDDLTYAGSWRGDLRIDGPDGFVVDSGRRVELWRERGQQVLRHSWTSTPDDEFADWVAREDRQDERSASARYASPEMTGVEDLDRNGRWEIHPDYGPVWAPYTVASDWAPYRFGHWAWVRPWGWTWVDDAAWGFAPFHYGRWVHWRGRWCWTPGAYVGRPVYSPALVAWVGGPAFGVSLQVGSPIGWVPLAPFEPYRPIYPVSRGYHERINPNWPHHRNPRPAPPPATGPIMYGNQGVPGGVTVVPSDVLTRRRPVPVVAHEIREELVGGARQRPLLPVAPPVRQVVPRLRGGEPAVAAPRPADGAMPQPMPTGRPEPVARPPVQPVPGGALPRPERRFDDPRPPMPRPPSAPAVVDLRRAPPATADAPVPAPGRGHRPPPPSPPPAPQQPVQAPAAAAPAPAPVRPPVAVVPGRGHPESRPPAPARDRPAEAGARRDDPRKADEPRRQAPESRPNLRERQNVQ